MKILNELKIGDVLAFKWRKKNVYVIFQIVQFITLDKERFVAVLFNSFFEAVPNLNDIKTVPYLTLNHHFWKHETLFVEGTVQDFAQNYLGNLPCPFPSDEKYSTNDFLQVECQYEWQKQDKYLQDNFKEQVNTRGYTLIVDSEQDSNYFLNIKKENPFITTVRTRVFSEALLSYIEENKFITELDILTAEPLTTLDLSQTNLYSITLDISNIERIILNEKVIFLVLKGDFSKLKEIVCPFSGAYLNLQIITTSNDIHFIGFSNLCTLSLFASRKNRIDINQLTNLFPNVEFLLLNGHGASLSNIAHIKKWQNMETLWLFECYGFEDFPKQKEMPKLNDLSLTDIPKVVGDKIKKEFKNIAGLELKKLRSDDWIKANLDNLLANWDGREGTPKAIAKKAMMAYSKSYTKLVKSQSEKEKQEILREFIAIFNQIDQKYPIDTLEREEIFEAYNELVKVANINNQEAENLFESNREF